MADLPLNQVGLHFLVGLAGPSLTAEEQTALQQLQPAGIILFKHNISASDGWMDELKVLLREVQHAIGRPEIIVSIDHEGGKVHRLPPPVTKFPAAAQWVSHVAAVGTAMGCELHALGINVSFSPVADVNSESTNPVIGVRAFSSSPDVVAEQAIEFLAALQATGVTGCAKHFPGHGHTTKDSHFELPVVQESLDVLHNRELVPFRALISAELDLIMTAHVVYPALDPSAPATLSRPILTTLLREQLGYAGAIVSDALEMKALSSVSAVDITARAMSAGVDLFLFGQDWGTPPSVMALDLASRLQAQLNTEELVASTARVKNLLKKIYHRQISAPSRGDEVLGCAVHQELLRKLQ